MGFLLDSTFLVDLQRRDPAALKLFESLLQEEATLIVPTVVLAEYLTGASDPEADTKRILDTAAVLQFTTEDAQEAARITREAVQAGQFPGWSDAFIAGVAKNRGGLCVVTRSGKHFPAVDVRTY